MKSFHNQEIILSFVSFIWGCGWMGGCGLYFLIFSVKNVIFLFPRWVLGEAQIITRKFVNIVRSPTPNHYILLPTLYFSPRCYLTKFPIYLLVVDFFLGGETLMGVNRGQAKEDQGGSDTLLVVGQLISGSMDPFQRWYILGGIWASIFPYWIRMPDPPPTYNSIWRVL